MPYSRNNSSSSSSGGGISILGVIAIGMWIARVYPPFGAWVMHWWQYLTYLASHR